MKFIAIDTNLLLLLVIGRAARSLLGRHKRLRAYSLQDFDLLVNMLDHAENILTTPNAMTEVSNLADQGVVGSFRTEIIGVIKLLIEDADERYKPSAAVLNDVDFARLGLTDCAWLGILTPEIAFITDDLDLYNVAKSRGLQAYNFNHLREERGVV
jgi:hypothetical protein